MNIASKNTMFSSALQAVGELNNNVSIEKYEPLLYQTAISFGFNDNELNDLVQQVCSHGSRSYTHQRNFFSLRIWLTKLLVHKCIFKISSELFSQGNSSKTLGHYYGYGDSHKLNQKHMPLSFRAVFILKNIVGFDENEIAEILNTTPLSVKQRLNKARAYVNNH